MADRGASAAFLAEVVKQQQEPFHLFELYLDAGDGGTVRNTDSHRTLVWGGNSYPANGDFMQFTPIQESAELRIKTCTIQLSGIDPTVDAGGQTLLQRMLSANYIDRRLVIYKGFMTAADALVVDPIAIFDGRCDAPAINEDPNATVSISITATDHWSTFDTVVGRHTNDAEQQQYFAGDTYFHLVSQINKTISWGR